MSNYVLEAILNDVELVLDEIGCSDSSKAAKSIVERIQKSLGGSECYIPAFSIAERNKKILQDFKGNNHAEVCSAHRISLRTLYRVTNSYNQ